LRGKEGKNDAPFEGFSGRSQSKDPSDVTGSRAWRLGFNRVGGKELRIAASWKSGTGGKGTFRLREEDQESS